MITSSLHLSNGGKNGQLDGPSLELIYGDMNDEVSFVSSFWKDGDRNSIQTILAKEFESTLRSIVNWKSTDPMITASSQIIWGLAVSSRWYEISSQRDQTVDEYCNEDYCWDAWIPSWLGDNKQKNTTIKLYHYFDPFSILKTGCFLTCKYL